MNHDFRGAQLAKNDLASPINTGFKVGASLLTDQGYFEAGNIEHDNSGLNMCADRLVIMLATMHKAIPIHLHLVTDGKKPTFPCGVCRQYMAPFPKLKVTAWSNDGKKSVTKTIGQLLPNPYIRNRLTEHK